MKVINSINYAVFTFLFFIHFVLEKKYTYKNKQIKKTLFSINSIKRY